MNIVQIVTKRKDCSLCDVSNAVLERLDQLWTVCGKVRYALTQSSWLIELLLNILTKYSPYSSTQFIVMSYI